MGTAVCPVALGVSCRRCTSPGAERVWVSPLKTFVDIFKHSGGLSPSSQRSSHLLSLGCSPPRGRARKCGPQAGGQGSEDGLTRGCFLGSIAAHRRRLSAVSWFCHLHTCADLCVDTFMVNRNTVFLPSMEKREHGAQEVTRECAVKIPATAAGSVATGGCGVSTDGSALA